MSRRRNERSRARSTPPPTPPPPWRPSVLAAAITGGAIVLAMVISAVWPGEPSTSGAAHPDHPALPGPTDAPGRPIPPTRVADAPPPGPAPEGMAWIPGGTFAMGCADASMADARPWHGVTVGGFWMDKTEVTNAQFARFVAGTGYVTTAERPPDWEEMKRLLPPGTPKPDASVLVPGSLVFTPPPNSVPLDDVSAWWSVVAGASWRHPEGPGSDLGGRANHPVVQVGWDDAVAYARWAGKRLPTEAEWEFAARGGLDRKEFAWGDEFRPGGNWMANTWQGDFPASNTEADGFRASAPVAAFPPNRFGLSDMAGNVWEWCSDWYRPDYYLMSPLSDPAGPPDSFDPLEPHAPKRVQRGGSFLCTDQYCKRYDPGARGKGEPASSASHLGFRCVRSPGGRNGK